MMSQASLRRDTGYRAFGAREITPTDLLQVDEAVRAAEFNRGNWVLFDDTAMCSGPDLSALLDVVRWQQVWSFELVVASEEHASYLEFVGNRRELYAVWYDSPQSPVDVIGVTRRITTIVEDMPRRRLSNRFVLSRGESRDWFSGVPTHRLDLIIVGAGGSALGGAVLALILKLAGAF